MACLGFKVEGLGLGTLVTLNNNREMSGNTFL